MVAVRDRRNLEPGQVGHKRGGKGAAWQGGSTTLDSELHASCIIASGFSSGNNCGERLRKTCLDNRVKGDLDVRHVLLEVCNAIEVRQEATADSLVADNEDIVLLSLQLKEAPLQTPDDIGVALPSRVSRVVFVTQPGLVPGVGRRYKLQCMVVVVVV